MPLPSSQSEWLETFQCYISLLTLVTYVARKYHSGLQNPFINRYPSPTTTATSPTPDQPSNLSRRQVLSHFSLCSVRNHEIIAAATVAVNNLRAGANEDPNHHYHDLADLFDIVITANPSSSDTHFSELPVDANQDIVHVPGRSIWPSIVDSEDPWEFFSSR